MLKRLFLLALVLVLLTAGAAGFAFLQVNRYLATPIEGGERTVIIARGSSLKSALDQLAAQAALPKPRWLYLYARAVKQTELRAGEYELSGTQTPLDVLTMLREGRVKTESFTLAEGLNRWQVRAALAETRWVSRADFDRLCEDAAFLKKHDVPGPSCEGYLFPETYTFARGVPPEQVMAELFATYRKNFNAAAAKGRGPLQLDDRQLTTLASIVEKETGAPEERPRIACVFYNRMQAKPAWKLETDPTVIYAATLADPDFDGNIKRSHLRELDHPYNTYKRHGLPPGPIASPGRAAFEAVVTPESCKDFFFVSMNDGRHVFCPTYDCHLENVEKWQVRYFKKAR